MNLVSILNQQLDGPWETASVIKDIQAHLSVFDEYRIEWIPREENKDAHNLAFFGWNSAFSHLCICETLGCTSIV